ncbi:hypothetical protein [Acinetobacter nosocomialis]|uniref:hypothetical protein n=1 Tax=Acinetobacter nosocomialis TaxID=106654 RepID=UPI000DE799B5|nr:hypothetical protein [Acinetobacter nosocomialis]SSR40385.1 Uncharacterised protein [Acinetobacter baumannii]MBR7688843.1 hypothetical protein [Acinetobacter nosocomialis]MBR7727790.1 hypothetical protein [Acinetobacter nosocomialis]MBS0036286.1 hypothetical protein [Acinetobacter nosocomialis]MDQ8804026.1 hypothetical protein [Acinetobacter nosocomialis]
MGYLRKNSFTFFLDANAPVANKTLSKNEIEEIELKHKKNKTQRMRSLLIYYIRMLGQTNQERLIEVARTVSKLDNNTNVLHEYIRRTFRAPSEMPWRTFCHEFHKIAHSQAEFPVDRYIPRFSTMNSVRFRQDGYLGVNVEPQSLSYDHVQDKHYDNGERNPCLWVTVDEGWEKDGNWGGYLRITCATEKNKYVDSSNGWVLPVASKADKVTFYDMGNYYEIWQGDRNSGRPLTVEGDILRFVSGATPAKWNIHNL